MTKTIKPAALSAVLFSQFVAAEAGNQEALHDQRLCAAYTAIFNSLRHGNHTQLNMVAAACALYGQDSPASKKARLDACGQTYNPEGKVAVKGSAAAAKRMYETYAAYGAAMSDLSGQYASGKFAVLKAELADVEALAAERAGRFVGIVTDMLESFAPATKTAAEKAAAKAEKEKAAKKAEKAAKEAQEKAIADEVAKITGNMRPLTLADMVAVVAEHIRTGSLPTDLHNMLADAAEAYELAKAARGMDVSDIVDVVARDVTEEPARLAA